MPTDKVGTWLYKVTKNETLLFLRKKDNNIDFLEDSEIIQEQKNTNSFENTIIEEPIVDTTNYLSIGMFSISAIFLVLTIIFSIFLVKHQLNAKKKASK